MTQFIRYVFLSLVLLSISCSKKLIAENLEKVERKKTHELIDALDSISKTKPNSFYTKISTRYRDTTQNVSFKTSIRLVKDSAINALITYANFPIYNSLLSPDTLTIVNKRGKCFTKATIAYLKENFGVNFAYANVEELILGLPIAYDDDQKYFQIHDQHNYIISSHRKREIRKSDKKEKYHDDVIIKYFLSNDLKSLKKMELESVGDSTSIVVRFLKRIVVSEFSSPDEVFVSIKTPRNNIEIELDYEKIHVNEPQQIYVVIPEEYEECK